MRSIVPGIFCRQKNTVIVTGDWILGHKFGKKDSSLGIHSLFYWRFLEKTNHTLLCFKIPYKKNPRNKKTRVYSLLAFSRMKNEVWKPDKTRLWEGSCLCPETSTKTDVQEFHLRSWIRRALKSGLSCERIIHSHITQTLLIILQYFLTGQFMCHKNKIWH